MMGSYDIREISPRFGDWTSRAFNLFGEAWPVWVVHTLLLLIVPGVLATLVIMVGVALGVVSVAAGGGELSGALVMIGTFFLAAVVVWIPTSYLYAGMIHLTARQVRGERVEFRDIMVPGETALRLFGTTLVMGLLISLASLFCLVPGLILAGLWLYAPILVVDRGMSMGEALSASARATRPFLGMYVLWAIAIQLVASVGSLLAGVGMLITVPVALLMVATGYAEVFALDQEIAARVELDPNQPSPYGYGQ